MSIGRNMTMLMYDQKIKQKELAESLGVSEQTISRFVNDEKIPSTNRLIQIAKVLNVTLDELVR